MLRVIILIFIPDAPRWLDTAKDVLAHNHRNMKLAQVLEVEMALHKQFRDRLGMSHDHENDPLGHQPLTGTNIRAHMKLTQRAVISPMRGGEEKSELDDYELTTPESPTPKQNPMQETLVMANPMREGLDEDEVHT